MPAVLARTSCCTMALCKPMRPHVLQAVTLHPFKFLSVRLGMLLHRPNRNPLEEVALFQSLQEAFDWALLSPTFRDVRSSTCLLLIP